SNVTIDTSTNGIVSLVNNPSAGQTFQNITFSNVTNRAIDEVSLYNFQAVSRTWSDFTFNNVYEGIALSFNAPGAVTVQNMTFSKTGHRAVFYGNYNGQTSVTIQDSVFDQTGGTAIELNNGSAACMPTLIQRNVFSNGTAFSGTSCGGAGST